MSNKDYTRQHNEYQESKIRRRSVPLTNELVKSRLKLHQPNLGISKTNYVAAKVKITVTCDKHGDFSGIASRIIDGGCPKCRVEKRRADNYQAFRLSAEREHKGFYRYDESSYVNALTKMRINCPEHGWFLQNPANHRKGHGCLKCTGINTWDTTSFFEKCREVHKGKFSYPNMDFRGVSEKILVSCPTHGDFECYAGVHLNGHDCNRCASQRNFGFSRSDFVDACSKPDRVAKLYVIGAYSEGERFYKIGITSKSVKSRFKGLSIPYDYDVFDVFCGDPKNVFDAEKFIHKALNEQRYMPSIHFGGHTECFFGDISLVNVAAKDFGLKKYSSN